MPSSGGIRTALPGALSRLSWVPWWQAAQVFIRWARAGVWERLLDLVQNRGVALGMVFLDGNHIRAHQESGGRGHKGGSEPSETIVKLLGRSRGGFGTKACVIADGEAALSVSASHPVRRTNCPTPSRCSINSGRASMGGADRGYSSYGFREAIWNAGARPAIPTKSNEAPVACPAWIYNIATSSSDCGRA